MLCFLWSYLFVCFFQVWFGVFGMVWFEILWFDFVGLVFVAFGLTVLVMFGSVWFCWFYLGMFSSVLLEWFSIGQDLLANSLEYPERIQRGLEWTQLLKRLSVCSLSVLCHQIF